MAVVRAACVDFEKASKLRMFLHKARARFLGQSNDPVGALLNRLVKQANRLVDIAQADVDHRKIIGRNIAFLG